MPSILGVSHLIGDAPNLNCDHANLSALLQFYDVSDPSSAIGAQWHFGLRPPGRLPAILRVPVLDAIAIETGLVFESKVVTLDQFLGAVDDALGCGVPVMVYGNQFHMPWVPYYQHEVASHPFIVDGSVPTEGYHALEAYQNTTDWGECAPSEQWISEPTLLHAVSSLDGAERGKVISLTERRPASPLDVPEHLSANAEHILTIVGNHDELGAFSRRARSVSDDVGEMKLFDLSCWELARSRSCHLGWLRRTATEDGRVPSTLVERFETEVVAPWRRALQFAHLGYKRVEGGGRAPMASFDLIEKTIAPAEVAIAHDILREVGTGRDD